MMQMVDSASAHTNASFLADKHGKTTLAAFKVYHAMAEWRTGRKLLCIRTDEGPEFCNALWVTYLAELASYIKPPPPTPSSPTV